MSDEERLVAEIPSELKELIDADKRTNKEIVTAALWREFGGERRAVIDRRIEEKKRRISMRESERNEREREINELQDELEALEKKREADNKANREQMEAVARSMSVCDLNASDGLHIDQPAEWISDEANRLGCPPDDLIKMAKEMHRGEYDD